MKKEKEEELLIHTVACIGSFTCSSDENVGIIVRDSGIIPLLLSLLSHLNSKLIETSLRTLNFFFDHHYKSVVHSLLLEGNTVDRLVRLIKNGSETTAQLAACLLASFKSFSNTYPAQNQRTFQDTIASLRGTEAAVALLSSTHPKVASTLPFALTLV